MSDSGARKPPPGRGSLPEGRANQPQRLPSQSARPTLRPPPPPRVVSGGAAQPVTNASANCSTPSRSFSDAAGKKLRFYGVVAAGSFAGIVIAGLFVVIKADKDRLALLETQERSRGKIANAASEQTLPAPSSDAPPSSGSPITNASPVEPVNSTSSDAISATSEAPKLPESGDPVPESTALVAEQKPAPKETIVAAKAAPPQQGEAAAKQVTESKPDATEAPTALAAWQLPESPANATSVKTSWFAVADANASSQETSEPVCSADRSLHTALIWSKSPDEASALARREGKLVFLIHVSGNFEDPGFT